MTIPPPESSPECTIVVPFHNHWEHLRPCLWSLRSFTRQPFELFLVDDASDEFVKAQVERFVATQPSVNCRILRHDERQGFVKSCNRALSATRAPYVVLLNSDTLVTPGWLDKLIECARSDERIGLVNPLSNRASVFSVPMPMGMSFLDFARALDERSLRIRPDVVTASGFCVMLTRRALDELGQLDEVFGEGYGEETDYSLRALAHGFRVVAADDAFVWHCGRITFGEEARRRLLGRNKEIVVGRWSHIYEPAWREYQRARPLDYLKDLFPMPPLDRLGRDSLLTKFRMARDTFGYRFAIAKTARYLAARARILPRRGAGGGAGPVPPQLRFGPPPRSEPVRERAPLETAESVPARVAGGPRSERPRVIYLMWHLKQGGGSHSVVQLVNRLTLLGWDAKIALTMQRDQRALLRQAHYTQPYFYETPGELMEKLPAADIYVATYWPTAYWAAEIVRRVPNARTAYFVQDYEVEFYPEGDEAQRRAVIESYPQCEHRIVKTRWLADALAGHGQDSRIIRAGLDLDTFYALPGARVGTGKEPHLVCAARRDPRRGTRSAVHAIQRVRAARPDVRVTFFGSDPPARCVPDIPFSYEHVGPLTPFQMAELYRSADVFIDASRWQGLGRTTLEAMACGCPCVVTKNGGIRDFAAHEENALLADPEDPESFARQVVRVLDDPALRARLTDRGIVTATEHSLDREVAETAAFFQSIIARQSASV